MILVIMKVALCQIVQFYHYQNQKMALFGKMVLYFLFLGLIQLVIH